jgi:hypothetical protein
MAEGNGEGKKASISSEELDFFFIDVGSHVER